MSTILRRFRRGTEAQILDPANLIAEGEVWYATDTATLYVGDAGGNKNPIDVGSDPILEQVSKQYDGVTTGTRIDVTTDGNFAYEKGRWFWFKSDANILKPVGLAVNGGIALTCRDGEGNEIDVEANKIYLASYESAGSDFFILASGDNADTPVTTGNIAWCDKYDGVIQQVQDTENNIVNINVGDYIYNHGGETKVVTGGDQETIDRSTPVEVVAQADSMVGNGGRKLVRLDSGRIITVTVGVTNRLNWWKSDDDGETWSRLCYIGSGTNVVENFAMVTDGVNIHLVLNFSASSQVCYYRFNGDTQTDIDVSLNQFFDTNNSYSGMTMAIASNGDIHVSYSCRNATYPDADNIKYTMSTDGGDNWSTIEQLTNEASQDKKSPSIVIGGDGYPHILYSHAFTDNRIRSLNYTGVVWNDIIVYEGVGGYEQSRPCADVLSNGTIIVAWRGKDALQSVVDNVRFSQSIDNGANWSTMEKLTNIADDASINPSIIRNRNDKIFVVYNVFDTGETYLIEGNSGNWSSRELIDTATTNFGSNPSCCVDLRDFEKPLTVYEDSSAINFYGKWTIGTETGQVFPDIDDVTDANQILSTVAGALLFQDGTLPNKRYTGFKSTVNLI